MTIIVIGGTGLIGSNRHNLGHSTWPKHDPLTSELARCVGPVVVGHEFERQAFERHEHT
jgi:hypothetical protein